MYENYYFKFSVVLFVYIEGLKVHVDNSKGCDVTTGLMPCMMYIDMVCVLCLWQEKGICTRLQ